MGGPGAQRVKGRLAPAGMERGGSATGRKPLGGRSGCWTDLYISIPGLVRAQSVRVLSYKGGLIHMVINLDFDTILVWILVGLVAGFFASHWALGHGLGIVGDVIAGVVGALVGGFLAGVFHWSITIVGHPILSAIVIAFIGAVIVLMVVRLFASSDVSRRAY